MACWNEPLFLDKLLNARKAAAAAVPLEISIFIWKSQLKNKNLGLPLTSNSWANPNPKDRAVLKCHLSISNKSVILYIFESVQFFSRIKQNGPNICNRTAPYETNWFNIIEYSTIRHLEAAVGSSIHIFLFLTSNNAVWLWTQNLPYLGNILYNFNLNLSYRTDIKVVVYLLLTF